MKRKRLKITSVFVSQLFGTGKRAYEVTSDAIPEDGKVIGARFDPLDPEVVEFLVESEEFPEVEVGKIIPEVTPQITVHRLYWTSEKPTQPGWYWVKWNDPQQEPEIHFYHGIEELHSGIRFVAGPLTPPEEGR